MTRPIAVDLVARVAEEVTGSNPSDSRQTAGVSFARALAMIALADEFSFSGPEAAKCFGRSESSVSIARRRVLHRVADSERYRELERRFQERLAEEISAHQAAPSSAFSGCR